VFEGFYGLSRTPFGRDLPPGELFDSADGREALARLDYLVQRRAFGVLTGDSGAGKTTALRALAKRLDPARHRLLYLAQSDLNPRSFYREIVRQMGLTPAYHAPDAKRQAAEALWSAYEQQRQPVLVCDEAHLLSPTMLEEIRFCLNFGMDATSPLTLILAGQTELRHRLALRAFEAIRQRVALRYHLTGLTTDETAAYLRHHLQVAGASRPIFSDEATALIAQAAGGLPRRINNLATACLLAGWLEHKAIVDEATARQALAEWEEPAA
jgi:general secretion pathway protein A